MAVNDSMGQVLWTRHFLAAQGKHVLTTTIYQDNKSTILLAENGKTSSSKRTRHLDIRYFFVTDKIKKGKVEIAYCPMQEMLGDFFTKPIQGTQFARMRSKLLNLPSSSSTAVRRSVLEQSKKLADNKRAILKNEGLMEPSQQHINKTLDKLEEEHNLYTRPTIKNMESTWKNGE